MIKIKYNNKITDKNKLKKMYKRKKVKQKYKENQRKTLSLELTST